MPFIQDYKLELTNTKKLRASPNLIKFIGMRSVTIISWRDLWASEVFSAASIHLAFICMYIFKIYINELCICILCDFSPWYIFTTRGFQVFLPSTLGRHLNTLLLMITLLGAFGCLVWTRLDPLNIWGAYFET